jgi:hypothetical protein
MSSWIVGILRPGAARRVQAFFALEARVRDRLATYAPNTQRALLPLVISITAYLFWRQRAAVLPAERVSALGAEDRSRDL